MEAAHVTEEAARSFLLGDGDEPAREQIEELFLTDPGVRETILIVEENLIEDYLEGTLAAEDAEKFRARYAGNAIQRRKLRISQALRARALVTHQAVPAAVAAPRKSWAIALWPLNWRVAAPLLATVAVAVLLASVWLAVRMNRAGRENAEQASVERQIAEMNTPARLGSKPPQMLSFTIAPIALRSAHPSSEVVLGSSATEFELNLVWMQKEEFPVYRAELSRSGVQRTLRLPSLQLDQDRRLLRVRLPAQPLESGLYRITITGVGAGGASATEEYNFTIRR